MMTATTKTTLDVLWNKCSWLTIHEQKWSVSRLTAEHKPAGMTKPCYLQHFFPPQCFFIYLYIFILGGLEYTNDKFLNGFLKIQKLLQIKKHGNWKSNVLKQKKKKISFIYIGIWAKEPDITAATTNYKLHPKSSRF